MEDVTDKNELEECSRNEGIDQKRLNEQDNFKWIGEEGGKSDKGKGLQ